jgi:outer membrane protein
MKNVAVTFGRSVYILVGSLLAAALLTVMSSPASAETEINLSQSHKHSFAFTTLLGAKMEPVFFGSPDTRTQTAFRVNLVSLKSPFLSYQNSEISKDDPLARPNGFAAGLSFGYVPPRDTNGNDALKGLKDIDRSVEMGMGVGYATPSLEVLAAARYGLTGHNAWAGSVRAYYVARPSRRIAIRVGPVVELGSDKYVRTYFGISDAETLTSGYSAYRPSGGLVSFGAEIIATYKISEGWWMEFGGRWNRYQNDAANSPIVRQGSDTSTVFRLGIRRAFRINF